MLAKPDAATLNALKPRIHAWARELGFSSVGFAATVLGEAENELMAWLASGYHGEMHYMARHGLARARPAELMPGTASVISARMQYLPAANDAWSNLRQAEQGYVARYALGRDYHDQVALRVRRPSQ